MFPGVIRSFQAVSAVALIAAATLGSSASAIADPGQDQRFFDLLGQKEIPPVDNANSLITSARHACEKLDAGMPVGDLVELVRTNGFNDNPLARLQPQDRVTRTIDQFINAAVRSLLPAQQRQDRLHRRLPRGADASAPGLAVDTYSRWGDRADKAATCSRAAATAGAARTPART